jgi:NADPH:quinone reductase-like Zn-dependent oxidoreductase
MKQYFQAMILGPIISMMGNKKMGTVFAPPTHDDYNFLIELFEAGKLKPVIDRRFQLNELSEAFQYYGDGHAIGKIVITVEPE